VTALLHNMSVAPRTVITWRATPEQQYCRKLRFHLPAEPALTISGILEQLAPEYRGTEARKELSRRIENHAQEVMLPPAALASSGGESDESCERLLTVCTVLAKSSGAVYLRDKEPNLSRLAPGASVILHIPKNWSR
jgi:hypothetical protein